MRYAIQMYSKTREKVFAVFIWLKHCVPEVLMLFLCAGCMTVGPDYAPPETSVPDEWHNRMTKATAENASPFFKMADWWSTFKDPALMRLIEAAIVENKGLQEAKARVRESRARRGISQAYRFPSVDASGSARSNRSSEDTGSGSERELYAVGFDAAWEMDVFGGKKRAVEAAEAELQASEEAMRDVYVSLLAEVARNYVDLRLLQTRLSVAEANLEAQEGTYDLTRWRCEAKLTSQLDVEQARSSLEQTRAQIPGLQSGIEQAMNRLAVLTGRYPGHWNDDLAERRAIPVASMEVAVGVPAEMLRRRPDIRKTERQLASQTAQIGAATADLYPKFSLLGSIGLEAFTPGDLFSLSNRTHGVGATVSWPVFDAGAIRNNIEVKSALQEQALIQYEETVLAALEEVENALAAYAHEQRRRASLGKAEEAARNAVFLARQQYSSGLVEFGSVLIAQKSLFSIQDQLAVSEGAVTTNLIVLYKSLGGGWESMMPVNQNGNS